MLIVSSISRGLGFWSLNHISIYKISELNFFKKIKVLGELSSNWPYDLLGTNVYNTLDFYG